MAQEDTVHGVTHVVIASSQAGQRIDNFLLTKLKGVPRTRIYRLLRKGEVRVNGKRIKPDYRLQDGDNLRIPPVRLAEREALPEVSRGLQELLESSILYEDSDLMVLNKPSGLASHGGTGVSLGLIEAARKVWPSTPLELAHRLDKGTSGCLILTKSLAAGNSITGQFRQRSVSKTYHALVDGLWPAKLKKVDAPLHREPERGGERRVTVSEEGKAAVTAFRVLQQFPDATLLEAMPESGRTHQIRVHTALHGHPLLGDDKYASDTSVKRWKERGVKRLCLHAYSLEFETPSGQHLAIVAPYDDSFQTVLGVAGRQGPERVK